MPWKQWKPGDPVTINRIVWDGLESEFMQDVLERDWFGPGHYATEFEKSLAEFVGVKHAQLTNSGSSALLIATQALQKLGRWLPGDLVLHPACTFPTSCNPIWQSEMNPVFADVEEGTYNLDIETADRAFRTYPIAGAIIPHLLGNSPEIDKLLELLDGKPLIEDCCDTLGSLYDGKQVGTFGDVAAFSFYGSHHITTAGVGGALLTNDDDIAHLAKSMAFWGRQYIDHRDPKYQQCRHWAYLDFLHRYTYETIGYDMQMTEIQAAFGLAQMQRLKESNEGRVLQFDLTNNLMSQWLDWLVLPKSHPKAYPSWFGYPVLVRDEAPFDREVFARHLLDNKIEIRPLFAGNLTRQPAYRNSQYFIAGDLAQSNRNMECALFLPSWGEMTVEQTGYMFEVIERFMERW